MPFTRVGAVLAVPLRTTALAPYEFFEIKKACAKYTSSWKQKWPPHIVHGE